jgi:hypothetical protein
MLVIAPQRKIYEHTFQLRNRTAQAAAPGAPPPPPEKVERFDTDYFELKGHRNVKVTVSCPTLNGWLVAEGDLVQQSNQQIQPFLVPLTHYSGTEDGEAWTEGKNKDSVIVSAQPAGRYAIGLEVEKEHPELTGPITVTVEQGAASGWTWFLALLGIAAVPAGIGVYHLVFNSTRWSNSSIEPPREPAYEVVHRQPPPPIDEPIPLADESGASSLPVARPAKKGKRKKRPREEDDDAE